jgi:hypothetical protein
VDYDADGDQDVLIVNYGAAPILYRNDNGNEGNWLRVKAQGTISNRDGIGAFIKVVPDASQPQQFQVWEIGSGDSYLSQSERTAHFGFGEFAGPIDLVEISWPASGIVQRYHEVPMNTVLAATEQLVGDFNGDWVVDAADYTVWRASLGMTGFGLPADAPGPGGFADGVIDQFDYLCWRANFGHSARLHPAAGSYTAPVPEPSALLSMLAVSAALLIGRQRSAAHVTVGTRDGNDG